MKKALLLVLGLLASCATPVQQALTAEQVTAAVTVERDEFSKTATFDAPTGGHDEGDGNGARWFLRAVQSTEVPSVVRFVLRFHRYSPEWCFYSSAWAQDGKQLKLDRTDSKVDAGVGMAICRDYYSVSLTREDLERAAREGMRIKLSSRRGDWVLGFPAYYAAGFLARVDGAQPAMPAK